MTAKVGVLMGSKSDLPAMRGALGVLDELAIPREVRVLSAHRSPEEAADYARTAADRGLGALICGAGMAAHLAGVVASHSLLPVIGVPMGGSFMGMDAMLATAQMPPGVPVACVAVGGAGAKNAAWLAARILALSDASLRERLAAAREAMRARVLADDAEVSACE